VWWVRQEKVDEPRKDEVISRNKLRGMGIMGKWMEVGAQLGIGIKLIIVMNVNIKHHLPIVGIHP
jgi:hypothetical protein